MLHQGTKELQTSRLLLRPFRESDAEAMYRNWASDPGVTRYMTWQAHESIEATRGICALWEKESQRQDFYQWAIVLKESDEPIGSISVVRINEKYAWAELGYCIGRAWWGQGITAEALRAVIKYLLRDVGFRQVIAEHDVNNPNSGKVMRKAGMKQEGVLRRCGSNNTDPCCDLAVYSILAEELEEPSPAFRPLARVKQALSEEECIRVLEREKRGVLSVLGDGGYPYGVPINHWYDPKDGKLYFHSGPIGHKIDALRRDCRASFCVMDAGTPEENDWALYFKSVIVFGRLELVEDHKKALEISRLISYKFTQDKAYIEEEVRNSGARVLCFALIPEHISGKRVHEK
jgi:RimJ/RimL family protein N-acetyltransferase/nitroimidazol reductase NimA-like FMN-containing flavoprotein (pyridoxamine 5'-phosphate oxidase superfamily)